jgi:endonuclease/exonuclease/phosphatase family metal-dependent hydrolase
MRLSSAILFSLAIVSALAISRVSPAAAQVFAPVVVPTNLNVRIMAANLTDNDQTYEDYALRIFQGLRPDIVAIQEFNYLGNTAAGFRAILDANFGTNFSYFRESGYSIPNGIISRWPIAGAGSWVDDDPGVNDRGFAWARIDLPGTNDLYVVSVHLKASSGSSNELRRANQAAQIKSLIQANFPSNALMVVAGDCNIFSATEPALATLKSFLADDPVPTDATTGGDPDTNNERLRRYDYVLPSPSLNSRHGATALGSRSFTNGLVFDSRVFSPLNAVSPVQSADSGLAQHMAVLKDFRIEFAVTNFVPVPAPSVDLISTNILHWEGISTLTYTVQGSGSLTNWTVLGAATSNTTNFWFTNSASPSNQLFLRLVYP